MKHSLPTKKIYGFFVAFLFFLSQVSNSQNQYTKWYFGKYAALDFMTSPPTPILTSAMGFTSSSVYSEGTSSIADASGNLLFYTDGQTIWNQNNAVMANGTGLFGHWSSTQSALIVKQPGNSNIYYVFTTDATGALGYGHAMRYSIVDMSLAAGMGSVTTKNATLLGLSSEKLCAVMHSNQRDVWIIGHTSNSSVFSAYLLSSSGLAPGITSSAGAMYYDQQMIAYNNNYGCLKASPMGTKLGAAILNYGTSGPAFELYDFNPSTGIVSNALTLISVNSIVGHYGCEFSPDGSKFYGTFLAASPGQGLLYQWDLCAGSNSAVIASQYTVLSGDASQIQLAPDGKIYGSPNIQSSLIVINNPNAAGSACNYSNNGPSVSPKLCSLGLPNFVSYYKRTYTPITSSLSCQSVSFTSATSTVSGCGPSTQTVNSCLWLFGDPASPSTNTSSVSNPVHIFSAPGTYTVKQILYNFYLGTLDTLFHQVSIPAIPPVYAGFQICSGSTITLSFTGNTSYTWNTGATSSSITVSPLQNTTYTVQGLDANMCLNTSIQSVTVYPLPQLSITGGSSVCVGSTISQIASGALSYTWSTGENTSSISVSPAATTLYTLLGADNNGCTSISTNTVTVKPLPLLTISGSSVICEGESALQTVSGASSYTWSTGALTNTVVVSPPASTQYTIMGMDSLGCKNTALKTMTVSVCTGLEELNTINEVVVYPNPNRGEFSLRLKPGSRYYYLKVIDQLGKTVFEKKRVSDGDRFNTNLEIGSYLYILSDGPERTWRGKLIVE